MPYTSEVFGINTRINNYSYVDRNNLDKQFERYLRFSLFGFVGKKKFGSWFEMMNVYSRSDIFEVTNA